MITLGEISDVYIAFGLYDDHLITYSNWDPCAGRTGRVSCWARQCGSLQLGTFPLGTLDDDPGRKFKSRPSRFPTRQLFRTEQRKIKKRGEWEILILDYTGDIYSP